MSLFGTGRKEGIGAVLVLVALVVVQHAPSWWASTDAGGDTFVRGLTHAAMAFRDGGWPVWNPFEGDGTSFRAAGVPRFYPLYWPLAFGWTTLAWTRVAHAALACVLAYRMLRALSASRYSAFVGAGLYAMGWFLTCAWTAPEEAFAACWLPWIVTCAWNVLFPRRRATSAVLLGAALAAPFLTGGTATAILGVALGTLCVLAGLLRIDRVDRPPTALALSAAGVLAGLATAPIWVPWISSGPSLGDAVSAGPIPVAGLFGLAAPGLFGEDGSPVAGAVSSARAEAPLEAFALYPGALVLLIALLGLLRPKRTWIPLFWICVTGLALVLTLEHPLTLAMHRAIPVLGAHPAAPLAAFHLGVVILAALGLENFFDAPRARPLALPIAASLLLLATGGAAAMLFLGDKALFSSILGAPAPIDWIAQARATAPRALLAAATLAVVFLAWQRLGVLRLKQLVAVLALGEVLILGLAHHATPTDTRSEAAATAFPGAAPGGAGITAPTHDRIRFTFAERSRSIGRRPTTAEVRASRDVLVEAPPGDWAPSQGEIDVARSTADTTELRFDAAPAPRLLVIRRPSEPGWRARTELGPTALLRANRNDQAVTVPSGAESLRLVYREPGLDLGVALAAFGAVLALGLVVLRRR